MSTIPFKPEQILLAAAALAAAHVFTWLAATRLTTSGAVKIRRAGRMLRSLSLSILLLACLGGMVVALSESAKLLTVKSLEFLFPGPVNVMEGVEASKTALLGQGTGIYSRAESYPYLVTIYPPFFYIASAGLNLLTRNALEANRLISILSSTGLALVLGALFTKITKSKFLATALVAAVFLSPPFAEWLVFGRPDMLVWFLAMVGLYVLIEPRLGCSAMVSGMILGLALLTKQQALPVVLAAASYLVFSGRVRDFKAFTAALVGLCGLAFVGMQWISGGSFYNNVFEYPMAYGKKPEFNSRWLAVVQFKTLLLDNYLFVFIAAICALWLDLHNKIVSAFGLLFVFSVLSLTMLFGSWGAAGNYMLPVIISMYLSFASLLSNLKLPSSVRVSVILLAFCCTNVSTLNQPLFDYGDIERHWQKDKESNRAEAAQIDHFLNSAEGLILADSDSGWLFSSKEYLEKMLLFDGNHLSLYTKIFPEGFSQSGLVKDIENKRFAYILLNPQAPHPPQVTNAVARGYSQLINGTRATLYSVLR